MLDRGDVRELAEVRVNGRKVDAEPGAEKLTVTQEVRCISADPFTP
jgi:hypothetical protein